MDAKILQEKHLALTEASKQLIEKNAAVSEAKEKNALSMSKDLEAKKDKEDLKAKDQEISKISIELGSKSLELECRNKEKLQNEKILLDNNNFIKSLKNIIDTGKSLSEALILGSTSSNPQYDKRLFIYLPVQYMKTTS